MSKRLGNNLLWWCQIGCSQTLMAKEPTPPNLDMKKKLEYSQNILSGLVSENFEQVGKNAELLIKLGKQNWVKTESIEYRTYNQLFMFTAGSLVLAARDKNIDGATLFYTQMNISCMNCHRTMRRQ